MSPLHSLLFRSFHLYRNSSSVRQHSNTSVHCTLKCTVFWILNISICIVFGYLDLIVGELLKSLSPKQTYGTANFTQFIRIISSSKCQMLKQNVLNQPNNSTIESNSSIYSSALLWIHDYYITPDEHLPDNKTHHNIVVGVFTTKRTKWIHFFSVVVILNTTWSINERWVKKR